MANIKDLIQSIESGDSSFDEKLAAINAMEETLVAVRTKEQEAIDGGVAMIVDAVATMQRKVEAQIEVAKAIVPEKGDAGRDGKPGRDGKNGQDGRNGIDGQPGPAGKDGEDGVSVVDAKIDFDGSLVIGLSSGREINVGEVVAADLAEKIKVTMSTNSTVVVQDEGTTITSGVRSLNFTGTGVTATASGDSVTVNVTGGGGGSVTSVTGTSPVVSSGGTTPDISLAASYGDTQNPYASKTANNFLAAPNGTAGVPTFRAVAAADIPTLNQNTTGTASNVTGTVAIANGGTGQTTAAAAITALSGTQTSGRYLRSDGTNTALAAIVAGDVPTLNQNTTGTAANVTGIVAVANGGSGTATPSIVAGTNVTVTGTWPNQTIASSGSGGTITISNKTAAYTVVAGDLASVINCTNNTFTVSLTAAATLGSGFNVTIWNTSASSTITIDPSGTETIDGATTLILRSGEGMQVVCNGTNWQTGDKKRMRGYAEFIDPAQSRPDASGFNAIAIGASSTSTATCGTALGFDARNASENGTSISCNSGGNGSRTATGLGAMALGGSYASGTDSFAAAVVDNTSTYGATGSNAIVAGYRAKSSATYALAIGGSTNESSGSYSVTIGGSTNLASGSFSYAAGYFAVSTQYGKKAYSSGRFSTNNGSAQLGTMVLRKPTTDATASVLTTDEGTAASTNQVILPNNSAFSFTGTIIARQQAAGGSNYAAWEIKGAIIRDANAASTTLGSFNINALSATAGASAWVVALTADTTNGGLAITVTGAAATNIRWVATVNTSEVTYA